MADKKEIYMSRVCARVNEIATICEEEGIPFVMDFYLGNSLHCSTVVTKAGDAIADDPMIIAALAIIGDPAIFAPIAAILGQGKLAQDVEREVVAAKKAAGLSEYEQELFKNLKLN